MIDEVDSILIDEARTPLIISGLAEKPSDKYYKAAKIASAFERDIHYTVQCQEALISCLPLNACPTINVLQYSQMIPKVSVFSTNAQHFLGFANSNPGTQHFSGYLQITKDDQN